MHKAFHGQLLAQLKATSKRGKRCTSGDGSGSATASASGSSTTGSGTVTKLLKQTSIEAAVTAGQRKSSTDLFYRFVLQNY